MTDTMKFVDIRIAGPTLAPPVVNRAVRSAS
jgi:hypothetical protein